jgi:hypothetical protein
MTFERRIVVGLDDIRAVTLECVNVNCGSRLTISPDKLENLPQRCPRCAQQWIPPEPSNFTNADSAFPNFLRGIAQIRTFIKNNLLGVKILLEFEEPKS